MITFKPGMQLRGGSHVVTVARVEKNGVAVMTEGTRMGQDGYLRVRGIGHLRHYQPSSEEAEASTRPQMPTSPIRKGLVLRTRTSFGGSQEPCLDEVEVYAVGWDHVLFAHAGASWTQQGTYDPRDREVLGFREVPLAAGRSEMVPQVGYTVRLRDMGALGFFRDMMDYRIFLRDNLRSSILEEVWEDMA